MDSDHRPEVSCLGDEKGTASEGLVLRSRRTGQPATNKIKDNVGIVSLFARHRSLVQRSTGPEPELLPEY